MPGLAVERADVDHVGPDRARVAPATRGSCRRGSLSVAVLSHWPCSSSIRRRAVVPPVPRKVRFVGCRCGPITMVAEIVVRTDRAARSSAAAPRQLSNVGAMKRSQDEIQLQQPRRHFHFRRSCASRGPSDRALHQEFLDLADRPRGIEALRADVDAVHDRVAAEQAVRVLEVVEALVGRLVARVGDEAVGLQQARRADELVRVPPERRARGRAAGAQDALVEAVQLLALLRATAGAPARAADRR